MYVMVDGTLLAAITGGTGKYQRARGPDRRDGRAGRPDQRRDPPEHGV